MEGFGRAPWPTGGENLEMAVAVGLRGCGVFAASGLGHWRQLAVRGGPRGAEKGLETAVLNRRCGDGWMEEAGVLWRDEI